VIESPYVLVESNIIIDIVRQVPVWVDWSLDALTQHERVRVNPIIYAEICYQKTTAEEADEILQALELGYEELPRQSRYLASQAFRHYRQQGGTKSAPLPDFFIGAHAVSENVPIMTRDVSRYRSYFPTVELIHP
jgi:predicted nucleic acid-binding protein